MRLIRNTTPDGSCKYRLWNNALGRFEDDDKPGDLNEFFLIKLKDRNSEAALLAYAKEIEPRDPEFAAEVRELAARAGPNHPACKDPDNAPISAPVEDVGGLIKRLRAVVPYQGKSAVAFLCHEAADALEAALSPSLIQPQASLQARVRPWMLACFNPEIAADKLERNDRFIEEALELIQASAYPKERAHALVEYVYGRPQGDINQEVGGVMITLAAHCLAHGVDMHEAGETELARINRPDIIVKIRAKQAAKPKGSALPIASLIQPQGEERS